MSSERDPSRSDADARRRKQTSRLLGLAMSRPNPVAEDLRNRMAADDGKQWFQAVLLSGPMARAGSPDRLLAGDLSLEELGALKEGSKALFKKTRDREARLSGAMGYFLSIAAGLRHHHTRICSRSREELDPILLDLAAVAPAPWDELLGQAALSPRDGSP